MSCKECVENIAKHLVKRHPDLSWGEAVRRAKNVVERAEKLRAHIPSWLKDSSFEHKK